MVAPRRLFCIPGFGASRLGYHRRPDWTESGLLSPQRDRIFYQPIWLNFNWLTRLGWEWMYIHDNGRDRHQWAEKDMLPHDLVPGYYDYLHSYLLSRGFEPVWADYDWRQWTYIAGRKVLNYLRQFTREEPCSIVAHSKGGHIAAWCLEELRKEGELDRVKHLVTLCTPWYGSYAVLPYLNGYVSGVSRGVQILLVAGWVLTGRKLLEEATFCARTLPGMYELLPRAEEAIAAGDTFAQSMYDDAWHHQQNPFPLSKTSVHQGKLSSAIEHMDTRPLPPATVSWQPIIGHNVGTFGGKTSTIGGKGQRLTEGVQDGDGIVPVWSATPAGKAVWQYSTGHGEIMSHKPALTDMVEFLFQP